MRPSPNSEERLFSRAGGMNFIRLVPDYGAGRFFGEGALSLFPGAAGRQRPIEFRGGMDVVAIVAAGAEQQQAKQKIITMEKSAGADDMTPAIVRSEAITQRRIGVGK